MPRNPARKQTREKQGDEQTGEMLRHAVLLLPAEQQARIVMDALKYMAGDELEEVKRLLAANDSLPQREALSIVNDVDDEGVLGYFVGCSFPRFTQEGGMLEADAVDRLLDAYGIASDHALHPTRMRTGGKDEPAHFKTPGRSVFQEAARTLEKEKTTRVFEEGGSKVTFVEYYKVIPLPGGKYQLTRHFQVAVEGESGLNERLRQDLRLSKEMTQDKPQPLGTWAFEEEREDPDDDKSPLKLDADRLPVYRIHQKMLLEPKRDFMNGMQAFQDKTALLEERFRKLRTCYTQEDFRQAWIRWSDAAESFMYTMGFGGIRFVPKQYAKEMRAWKAVMEFAYGHETRYIRWFPVRNTDEMRNDLKVDAEADVQRRLDQVLEDVDQRLKKLLPKLAKGDEKSLREFERGMERLQEDVEEYSGFVVNIAERYSEILGGAVEDFRVGVPKPTYEMSSVTAAAANDPRVRAFLGKVGAKLGGDAAARVPVPASARAAAAAARGRGA